MVQFNVILLSCRISAQLSLVSFMQDYGFILPLFTGIALFAAYVAEKVRYQKIVKKYSVVKSNLEKTSKLTDVVMKTSAGRRMVHHISIRVGIITGFSFTQNCNIASKIVFVGFFAAAGLFGVFLAVARQVWYVSLSYSVLLTAILYLLLNSVSEVLKSRFTSKIPETYKILNLRYVSCGDIIMSIEVSMNDFDAVIRREMLNIYNTLRKNDASEITQAFRLIDQAYQFKFMSFLINLI